jgi:murein DD-endopeptidase MepM/ murein hydrolase activator NlpD
MDGSNTLQKEVVMGKWNKLLVYRDQLKQWNVQEQWSKVIDISSQGLSSALNTIKSHKVRFCLSMLIIGGLAGASFLGNQYVKANTNVIYHVIYKGQQIGTVNSPKVVEGWILKQHEAAQRLYPNTHIDLDPKLNYQGEKLYKGSFDNDATLAKLSSLMNIQAEAVEVVVDGKHIGYARDMNEARIILNNIQRQFTMELNIADKDKVHIASTDFSESQLVKVGFVEKVDLKPVKIEPGRVMNSALIEERLLLGSVEQVEHVVVEGDCLSCIAQKYGISVDDIYKNNPGFEGEFLKIGQVLKVTALQPNLTVRTVETKVDSEEVSFKIEYKNDSSMVLGTRKTLTEGISGAKAVTYEIIKENGNIVKKDIISERVLKDPVTKVVAKGTKVVPGVGTGKFAWPVTGGKISSSFGKRWGRAHTGIDITSSNRNILAADHGRIVFAGWKNGYGKTIIIDHGNGYETLYAHLRTISVSTGQKVEKRQKIGIMGNTGRSFGTHLHFEVIRNNVPRNPLTYL